jgi:pseudolysin
MRLFFLMLLSCFTSTLFAAQVIHLKHETFSTLNAYFSGNTAYQFREISETIDFNKTKHTRLQETYAGYPVWGADIVAHAPHTSSQKKSMNGTLYQHLESDLQATPTYALSAAQKNKALQQAIFIYQKKSGNRQAVSQKTSTQMIYIDDNDQAHWVYLVSFSSSQKNTLPEKRMLIMDAATFQIYKEWNDIKTFTDTFGGGVGGNEKTGKTIYDGSANNLSKLAIQRDDAKKICYLKNLDVTVYNFNRGNIMQFHCDQPNNQHNNIYWNTSSDTINGGYSPSNDALYIGKIVKDMYQQWYGIPVLTENGNPMMLNMQVHLKIENAYWDGRQMSFGDGGSHFYPLVSIGVGAHEISHGFTSQHSNLAYYGQSGGLNEAFSDMASQAALFYATQKNNWQIGDDIIKQKNKALRYLDEPTKDCEGRNPGDECSISHIKNYVDGLDVHFSSGIFNKVFYLLGTAKGWDTKKAFDVMVHANQNYWTSTTNFSDAACGVLKSAKDYGYSITAVKKAMKTVGVDIKDC